MLETYAIKEENSRGREYKVLNNPSEQRNEFQRDFSRVAHSVYFRKLRHKTQVYSSDIGNDFFRSRLDHSLEVVEIAKSISKALHVNTDLASVLALSHDIGHAPFGHLGQDVLDELMKDHGGFEHNIQALRILDKLDTTYLPFHLGLNLMYETREGLLKHCSEENAEKLGGIAERHKKNPKIGKQSFLEAQIVDWSDAIAYLHSDLEDAFNFKILTPKHFEKIPKFMESYIELKEKLKDDGLDKNLITNFQLPTNDSFFNPKTAKEQAFNKGVIKYVINNMLKISISDIIENSKHNILESGIKTVDDVRNHKKELVSFSDKMLKEHLALKEFSSKNIYKVPFVLNERKSHEQIIKTLFNYYLENIDLLKLNNVSGEKDEYRIVCDYVSGMTDKYASQQYQEIIKHGKVLERTERFEEIFNDKENNIKSTKNKTFKY